MVRHLEDIIPVVRPRRKSDDPFLVGIGAEAFAPWSHDPARTIAGMLSAKRTRTVVAEHEGVPIGFAVVDIEPLGKPFGPWSSPKVARLDAIAVAPTVRRRAVGTALIEAAEDLAADEASVVMTLMTGVGNGAARRFFSKEGYMPLFAIERSYANGESAIEMFKSLAMFD